jgi:hypothetical protein
MITKQRGELLGLSIALKTQKVDEKYKKKLLEYLEQLQKEETMEILLENSNIKKVIKKIDEERGI